jgi:hypothetical protein
LVDSSPGTGEDDDARLLKMGRGKVGGRGRHGRVVPEYKSFCVVISVVSHVIAV